MTDQPDAAPEEPSEEDDALQPQVVEGEEPSDGRGTYITEPSKLMRIGSMTRAMLDEVRQAPLDEAGRKRLLSIYRNTIDELKEVLSGDLREELDTIFLPLERETPTESELRIAQAQLVGWLEGLFHGIQASLWSQQASAAAQLEEMRARRALETKTQEEARSSGLYL